MALALPCLLAVFFLYHVLSFAFFTKISSQSLILDSSLLISDVMFLLLSSLNESIVLVLCHQHTL